MVFIDAEIRKNCSNSKINNWEMCCNRNQGLSKFRNLSPIKIVFFFCFLLIYPLFGDAAAKNYAEFAAMTDFIMI
jgi:hypothetical protein